jgi:hypothetical protein
MKIAAHKTRTIYTTLALGLSIAAVAGPPAAAEALDLLVADAIRAEQASPDLDPLVADAIRAEQASPDLDPLVADAIRHGQPDFWNYDPQTGTKTSNTSPGLQPSELATFYSPTGDVSPDSRALDFRTPNPSPAASPAPKSAAGGNSFQWDDAGIGAGAVLTLFSMGAVVGTILVRRRHGLLASR